MIEKAKQMYPNSADKNDKNLHGKECLAQGVTRKAYQAEAIRY